MAKDTPTPTPVITKTTWVREQERRLWDLSRCRGIPRRRFLQLLSAGGTGAVLAACATPASEPGAAPSSPAVGAGPSPWFKDTTAFIQHGGKNLETRLENLGGFVTPNELFFVRNNSTSIMVAVDSYRLTVDGDAIGKPLELSYQALLELPSHTLFAYIECGGNQRAFFDIVMGRPAKGTQWKTGGISMAEWTGVRLGDVLSLAGLKDSAVDVQLIGMDVASPEDGFRRPIPIEQAMKPDTILAYRMNGAILPPDHGFPIRAVVPGWVGSTSIKWLGRINVSSKRIWSRNNTTSYVLIGDAYPREGAAEGKVATLQSIKSALTLAWPARIPAGKRMIRGYAHSPHGRINKVDWSIDGGKTWRAARLLEPLMKYAWARFELQWDAAPGDYTLMTRASDEAGQTQPTELPFNEKGYLFNRPLPHPVTVL